MAATTDVLPARYTEARLIASGGMGRVFRATDTALGRDVAIKVLFDRYADDQAVRARFRREALAAARLSGHPNIVTIFDVAEYRGRPMIVMEYLEGGHSTRASRGRAAARRRRCWPGWSRRPARWTKPTLPASCTVTSNRETFCSTAGTTCTSGTSESPALQGSRASPRPARSWERPAISRPSRRGENARLRRATVTALQWWRSSCSLGGAPSSRIR